jgi:Sortase domain
MQRYGVRRGTGPLPRILAGLGVLIALLIGLGYLISVQPGKAPGAHVLDPSAGRTAPSPGATEPAATATAGSATGTVSSATGTARATNGTAGPTNGTAGPTNGTASSATARRASPAAGSPQPAPVPAGSRPARVRVPAIGLNSVLQPLGLLPDGSLQTPSKRQQAGWYAGGFAPGDVGSAVIAGQVNSSSGPAVFAELHQVRPGDQILITRQDGSVLRFLVDGIRAYPKRSFPAAEVYGPAEKPVLRLITCPDSLDQASDPPVNLVVSAHLA